MMRGAECTESKNKMIADSLSVTFFREKPFLSPSTISYDLKFRRFSSIMQMQAVLLNPLQVTVPHRENKKFKLHVNVEQRVKDAHYCASQSFCFKNAFEC